MFFVVLLTRWKEHWREFTSAFALHTITGPKPTTVAPTQQEDLDFLRKHATFLDDDTQTNDCFLGFLDAYGGEES